ncbi:MAG: cysteine desulfurase [Bacteroidales bacterium]|nr:cysteine desulfurase [Bacteroidales bacterium]
MDINKIREDFPILSEIIYDRPLVYLDNAATTQKPWPVIRCLEEGYRRHNANVHRGVHFLSMAATEAHEAARARVRDFLGAASAEEIVFTRGTTEAVNLVAFSFGETYCREGDEMVVSVMEHHSDIVPWQMLCERRKMRLRVIPMNDRGELLLDEYEKLLGPRTRLVAVAHVSNVLGTVNPVGEMIATAHRHGIPVFIDGAQAVPHMKVDVQALDADFYAFSAHKIYGPTGLGVLYGKKRWLEEMQPYQGGGEMIDQVHFEKTTYNVLPYKFEAGTPDFIGTTALAAALDYVESLGMDRIARYESQLLQYTEERLSALPGLKIYGQAAHKSAVVSFRLGDIHPYDTGLLLDKLGVAVRTGHHCAQPLMERLGIDSCVRASFSFYNTREETDSLCAALERIRKMF